MGWLDCVIECTNKHGLDNFWACMIMCSIQYPDEARQAGFLPPGSSLRPSDGFTPFEGCHKFLRNSTETPIKLLVTICNSDQDHDMAIDIDDKIITHIAKGECQGIIVEIPPGKALHGDRNGRWKAQSL